MQMGCKKFIQNVDKAVTSLTAILKVVSECFNKVREKRQTSDLDISIKIPSFTIFKYIY